MNPFPDEPRHPLTDALDAAARTPEAEAYEVPVELVRRRVGRRRAGRALGVSAVAVLVVVGTASALPRVLPRAVEEVAADAPPECRLTLEDLASDDGAPDGWTAALTAQVAGTVARGDWPLSTSFVLESPPTVSLVSPPLGWTYGTSAVVLRDGDVVAVLDMFGAPTREEASRIAVDAEPLPFPLVTEGPAATVDCATGEPVTLPAGDYEVVATQTVGWTFEKVGGTFVARATSDPTRVTVGPDADVTSAGCGTTEELVSLTDPRANPAPFAIEIDPPAPTAGGEFLALDARVVSIATAPVSSGFTGYGRVAVAQDGVIVGGESAMPEPYVSVDLDPGESFPVIAGAPLVACGTDDTPLPPGDYEVWVMAEFDSGGGNFDWRAAGGPVPLEITE